MKVCTNCGHENREDATRCEDCGWDIPRVHPYAKAGKLLKLAAGTAIILIMAFQFVSCTVVKASGGGGENGIYGAVFDFYSWQISLVAMVGSLALFWLGDYLKRTY